MRIRKTIESIFNPKISRESGWRYFITDNFQALGERIHLFEGKQYFMILLFQIKFFKIKIKASPEDWITIKQHIQSEDQKKQQGLDPCCFLPTLTDFLELALRFFRACPELAEGLPLLDMFRKVDWKMVEVMLKDCGFAY